MYRRTPLLLLLLLSAVPLFGQIGFGADPADATPKVTIEGAVTKRAGDQLEGVVTAKVLEGWHINSHKPLDEFAIPTILQVDGKDADATYPQHQMKAFEFSGGQQLAVYDGTITIPFRARAAGNVLKVTLKYQACSDRVCLPPNSATAEIDTTKISAATPGSTPAAGGNFTPLSAAPPGAKAVPKDRLARTFADKGLIVTLPILFVLGLALNLTPCVFPLIPITLGFFAMQSDGRRSRRFALSASYVLGLVITYSSLGVVAALGGKLFGAWLQLPAVLIGFAILMLVLATSMFGVFEIQPPRWIANKSQGRAGAAGALAMGLVVGIVAAPCVGPVVISLITLVAQLGDPFLGFIMFAALALGLGFPYLIALNALPRPGEWMVTVKKGMAFVLIAMAFYFLRPITGDVVFRWGVAASLLIGAAFLLASRAKGARVMRLSVGALLLVAGAAFAIPRGGDGVQVQWTAYDQQVLATARGAGKPVVIDFYADWCLPCKELDEKTFPDKRVAAELNRFVRVKADLTASDDPTTIALTKQYQILGVPTIVFIDAQGQERSDLRLTGFEGPEKFSERLKQVR
ncbi:MAG TPA: cytochrome c biogenesis protein CcdA [Thermoanaerobaculia bacterium]|jgi:thiol:disulfide interchange protein DsbD